MQQPINSKFLRTELVRLCEISVGFDSGWREVFPERVQELVNDIKRGEYGQTNLVDPTLMAKEEGSLLSSTEDGLYILENGKHWVMAMKEIDAFVAEMPEKERFDLVWYIEVCVAGTLGRVSISFLFSCR